MTSKPHSKSSSPHSGLSRRSVLTTAAALPLLSLPRIRTGWAQGLSEGVATFGLILTILLTLRARPEAVPLSVGLYITAAYWFTASTSFANPAVTIARALTDSFSGIAPAYVPLFIVAQLIGAVLAFGVARSLMPDTASTHKAAHLRAAE